MGPIALIAHTLTNLLNQAYSPFTSPNYVFSHLFLDVRTVAKAFIALGLEPRKSVGIIGFNSPEWFFADLAAIFANSMATGIYSTNSPEMCKYMANTSRANIIVVEDDSQLKKILAVKDELPGKFLQVFLKFMCT